MVSMADDVRSAALQRLDAFIGTWQLEASFLQAPDVESPNDDAFAVFEWALGGRFLLQRTQAPDPAPNSLAIVAVDADRETYTQHYFDSRGVVRVYSMTCHRGVWTLLRDKPDFSPVDFSQRYTGTFSDDGSTIRGRWEISHDGVRWEHDFDLSYLKVKEPGNNGEREWNRDWLSELRAGGPG
jgi:hypothetical protein